MKPAISVDVLRVATAWVAKLALLTTAGNTIANKERIALTATILAQEFPMGTFTDDSLAAVADGMEFFPAYATLKNRMERFRPLSRRQDMDHVSRSVPDWMFEKIMENVGGDPGPMLRNWLASKGRRVPE